MEVGDGFEKALSFPHSLLSFPRRGNPPLLSHTVLRHGILLKLYYFY